LVPAFLYSFYLTLYKMDTSLSWTLSAGPKGVRLRESWLYSWTPVHVNLGYLDSLSVGARAKHIKMYTFSNKKVLYEQGLGLEFVK